MERQKTFTKKMQGAVIAFGSNAGNRLQNLRRAARLLSKSGNIRPIQSSMIYETSPVGPEQRNFLNAVLKAGTDLQPVELLRLLKKTERALGRKKTRKWGQRPIDLDIIFYKNKRVRSRRLTVPHPRYAERKFVLKPLCDIDPSFKPPGSKRTVAQILSRLTDPGQKVKLHNRRGLA